MTIRAGVLSYCKAIHTQDPDLFDSLWSKKNRVKLRSDFHRQGIQRL